MPKADGGAQGEESEDESAGLKEGKKVRELQSKLLEHQLPEPKKNASDELGLAPALHEGKTSSPSSRERGKAASFGGRNAARWMPREISVVFARHRPSSLASEKVRRLATPAGKLGRLGPRVCERCHVPFFSDLDFFICVACLRGLCGGCAEGCFTCLSTFCHGFCRCLCHSNLIWVPGGRSRQGRREEPIAGPGTSEGQRREGQEGRAGRPEPRRERRALRRERMPVACKTDGDGVAPNGEAGRSLSVFAAPSSGDASAPLAFEPQDLDYAPWRPTEWNRLCAEAQKPERTFAASGHVFVDLVEVPPRAFRKYPVQLTFPVDDPSPPFRRQRDLLPLPMISFEDGDLPKRCSEAQGALSAKGARCGWPLLILSAVKCEPCQASRNGASRPLFGPATPIQTEAARNLAVAADLLRSLSPSQVGERDGRGEMKSYRIRYDGPEMGAVESVTAWQVVSALPRAGAARTVDLAQLLEGETKEKLLDPSLCRMKESEVVAEWARPQLCADRLVDEYETKALLCERGIVEAFEGKRIWSRKGRPVEDRYFGAMKAEPEEIAKKSKKAIRKLRGTWNMMPSNSLQAVILGDLDLLPDPARWRALHEHALQVILIAARDRSSHLNVFTLPAAWGGGLALVTAAPGCDEPTSRCQTSPSI